MGWKTVGATFLNQNTREEWEAIAIAFGVVLAFAAPWMGRGSFRSMEQVFNRFAVNRKQAILAAALFPVVVRLALLQVIPIPQPLVADEFGHLLMADTFASGRVTNPSHPLWGHFESLYVLQEPTYTSIYPIAQGLLLAVPVALGAHPWFGVCISMGCMCAALCWMLQGWLPLKWAALGAMLAGARFSIVGYWMNSYWGGAVGAIGGALLLGALPRILRQGRARDALLAGAGVAILSQSRPFEGLLLSLPVGALLLYRFLGRLHESLRVLVPLTGVSAMIVAGSLYYNWRVTGDALLLPYQLHQRIYGTPQNLRWSAPVLQASRANQQKDIRDNFEWQLGFFQLQSTWQGLTTALSAKLKSFWSFYLQPILSLPLLCLPWVVRRRGMRFLFFTGVFVLFAGSVSYPFFFPHYAAPLCGLLLVLVLQGARYLRVIRWPRMRVGAALFRWCLAIGTASCFVLLLGGVLDPGSIALGVTARSRIEEDLMRRGGKHLVLVRYQQGHSFHDEWIYNSADIDKSRVIWARELDEVSTIRLLRRYPDRDAWLAEPDREGSSLIAYTDRDGPQVSAILNAAGKSPFFRKGISPGSIVTLFGRNLGHPLEGHAGNCVLSGTRGDGRRHQETMLTGLDGARPGAVVRGLVKRLPSLAMAETRESSGAVLSLVRQQAGRAGRHVLKEENVGVRFGDLPAPVLCMMNSGGTESVTVQVPFGLLGESVNIVVRSGDHESIVKGVPVLPANPGIFQLTHAGKKAAVLLHPDGSLVSPENGARQGEMLRMFVTGIGAVDANGPRFPLIVGVNARGAPLQSVNCAECLTGIAELRFEVPQEAPSGEEIPLSMAVVVNGKPVHSNTSIFAIR